MTTAQDHSELKDRDQDRSRRQDDHQDGQRDSADRVVRPNEDHGRQERRQAQSQRPATMTILLMTAAVALICGVIGAMGYSYFVGAKPDEPSSSESKAAAGSSTKSGSNSKPGAEPARTRPRCRPNPRFPSPPQPRGQTS